MEKIQAVYGFILSILLFLNFNSSSQWLNDYQLSSDQYESQTSGNNSKSIIAKGDTIIVVWQSAVSPAMRIYSKRSTNGGVTWQDSIQVEGSSAYDCYYPSAAICEGRCYIVYIRKENSDYTAKVCLSSNYGYTWGNTITAQTADGYIKSDPSICADSVSVHVAFTYTSNSGVKKIMYKRSTNNGYEFNFGAEWYSAGNQSLPSITCSGKKIFLSYTGELNGNSDIMFAGSTNNGGSWNTAQITNDTSVQTRSSIAAYGDYVYIVWNDSKYGNIDIISKRSTNAGSSWFTESRLTSHSSDQYRANICAYGTNVHIVWEDNRDNNELYYLSGINHGGSWQSIVRLTDNSAVSRFGSIAVSGNTLHVVWTDERTGLGDVYYKRNPTGNSIGINVISSEIPEKYMLSQNYPNPFNPTTNIKFSITKSGFIALNVFDMLGKEVEKLLNNELNPGTYQINWDASAYPSGVYYYRLETENFTETRKMVLIK